MPEDKAATRKYKHSSKFLAKAHEAEVQKESVRFGAEVW